MRASLPAAITTGLEGTEPEVEVNAVTVRRSSVLPITLNLPGDRNDGKTLTVTQKGTDPQGKAIQSVAVYDKQ